MSSTQSLQCVLLFLAVSIATNVQGALADSPPAPIDSLRTQLAALADNQGASTACFDVVFRAGQAPGPAPDGAILINRCSGATWMLIRASLDNKGSFTYRWSPLTVDTSGEPVLVMPPMPPLPK